MLKFDNAPKKATNLSLNSKVLEAAREMGLNISQTVDALLADEVKNDIGKNGARTTSPLSRPTTNAFANMACRWPSTAPSRAVWATERKSRLEMARFDVYSNPDLDGRAEIPYMLDIQNTFMEVESRIVVPLSTANLFKGVVRDLNPQLIVQGKKVIMNTSALGAIPASDLRKPIANLASDQALIQGALDTLLGGY